MKSRSRNGQQVANRHVPPHWTPPAPLRARSQGPGNQRPASAFTCGFRLRIGVTPPTASVIDIVRQRPLPALATHSGVEGHEPYLTLARAAIRVCFGNSPREVVMSAEVAAEETRGPGLLLQPEEGQSYWQPIWANGYSIVKLSPKHAGPDNLAMGIQV